MQLHQRQRRLLVRYPPFTFQPPLHHTDLSTGQIAENDLQLSVSRQIPQLFLLNAFPPRIAKISGESLPQYQANCAAPNYETEAWCVASPEKSRGTGRYAQKEAKRAQVGPLKRRPVKSDCIQQPAPHRPAPPNHICPGNVDKRWPD